MIRKGFLFGLLVIGVVLLITNPGEEAHQKAVYTSLAAQATKSELVGKIAADVLGDRNVGVLSYHNYFIYSTTTLNDKTASVGLLSRVWNWK